MKNIKVSWYLITAVGLFIFLGSGFIKSNDLNTATVLGVISWAGLFITLLGIVTGIYEGIKKSFSNKNIDVAQEQMVNNKNNEDNNIGNQE